MLKGPRGWFSDNGNAKGGRLDAVGQIRAAADRLEAISSDAEPALLAFGEQLNRFNTQAGEIARLSSTVAQQLSGDKMRAEIQGLQFVLERTTMLDESSRRGINTLSEIHATFEVMQQGLDFFESVTRHLQVLCRLIKIESARFDVTHLEFQTLSEDVHKLTDDIRTSSGHLREASISLMALIRSSQQNNGTVGIQRNASSILDGAFAELRAFEQGNKISSRLLEETSERWRQISKGISEIVSSLQFHDITRQRLEHAADSIRQLSNKIEEDEAGRAWLKFAPGRISSDVVSGFRLQQEQILHAGREMEEAGSRIIRSTRRISEGVAGLSRDSCLFSDDDGITTSGFVAELEKTLASLGAVISDYETAQQCVMETLQHVSEQVALMSRFIHDIERIGIEIRKVALNAVIHASNAGDQGMAMGVLAGSIHQLSVDTESRINLVAEKLKAILSMSGDLSLMSEGGRYVNSSSEKMTDRLVSMVSILNEVDVEISAALNQVKIETALLQAELDEAASGMHVHLGMGQDIRNVSASIQTLLLSFVGPEPSRAALNNSVRDAVPDLSVCYTMEKERDVHRAFLSGHQADGLDELSKRRTDDVIGDLNISSAAISRDEDYGDNVELF